MNSGLTSERVYTALKRRLLDGEFRPGERLDPAMLSETLSSSVTPVRDVLNILRGERLVETRTGEGFFRPHLTAPDLEDLYSWCEQVLLLAIRNWPATTSPVGRSAANDSLDAGDLFQQIAGLSPNAEHGRALAGINDRLHAVRIIEAAILGNESQELENIDAAIASRNPREVGRLITFYFRRRRRSASEIVRAVYRST